MSDKNNIYNVVLDLYHSGYTTAQVATKLNIPQYEVFRIVRKDYGWYEVVNMNIDFVVQNPEI